MNRRAVLVGVAALVAAAAGIGVRRWRARSDDVDESAEIDLWSLSFQDVDGNAVPMAALRGRPLLLNFWATWCGPCVVEMPLLDRFARERSRERWQVLALAIDQPDPVRRFIAERTLRLPVAIAGTIGLDLSRQLGNRNGGLPFTAAFDSTGAKSGEHLGAVDVTLLDGWVGSIH
ncbi:MAG TPA: TlpA disulfide reductase family protein [Caldimonas sp.]